MSRMHSVNVVGLLSVVCVLGGCDALSSLDGRISGDEQFVAVDVAGIGGADGLSAKVGIVESESATVSMPGEDILADTPDDVSLTLQAESITVVVHGEVAGRRNPSAKGQEHHASITFRMAERDSDACEALQTIGPFELTVIDGVVTLEQESFALNTLARSLIRNGRFEMCAETLADFDGSITLGGVSFEFGHLRGDQERVVLCHIPPGDEGGAHTITVAASAADAHLAHGDYLGDCEDQVEDDTSGGDDDTEIEDGDNDDGDGDDDEDAAVDSDGDGVADEADACPDTLAGETVDEIGCACSQRDGDSDGVDDCSDTCPHTANGDAVDASGCAEADNDDDDVDGVRNGTDACPDTLADETVDESGCACSQRDGDADGVDDCSDECPNSESAVEVDETGCADADLDDDDADGVINGTDTCASTPSGETTDSAGCSCSQKDSDADGVNDCSDTCASTSEGLSVSATGCATNQLDDDNDGVMNDADACANTATGVTVGTYGCSPLVADAGGDSAIVFDGTTTVGGSPSAIGGDGSYTYGWLPATGLGVPIAANPVFTATVAGDFTITLTVTDGHGETATDEVVVTVAEAPTAEIVSLATGKWHNILLFDDGATRSWGWNQYGQLGDGSLATNIAAVDGSSLDTVVAKTDGTAWVFGFSSTTPVQVLGATNIVQVGALETGGILLRSDGTVLGFNNDNNNCELAGTQYAGTVEATPISGLPTNITAIDAGTNHTVALDASGTAWVWGWSFGCTPWSVLDNVTAVAAGDSGHCLFLRNDGTVWSLGFNLHGQLGNGTRTTNYGTASQISGLTSVTAIAAGDRHSIFLKNDRTLWTCGWATNGRLGLSDDELAAAGNDLLFGQYLVVPKLVGLTNVAAIGGGQTHSVATQSDGTVWAWGYNTFDQLSGATSTSLPDTVATPIQIDLGQ